MANRPVSNQSPYFRSDSRDERILPAMIATAGRYGRSISSSPSWPQGSSCSPVFHSGMPSTLQYPVFRPEDFIPRPEASRISQQHGTGIPPRADHDRRVGPFTLFLPRAETKPLFSGKRAVEAAHHIHRLRLSLVISDLYFISGYALSESVRQGLFMTTAAVSTTGFRMRTLTFSRV